MEPIINQDRPIIPPGTHPIDNGRYLIATNEINRMFEETLTWIQNRLPGAMIIGDPRLGKTRAIKYIQSYLPSIESIGAFTPVFTMRCPSFKTVSEITFFEELLKSVNHHLPFKGNSSAKKDRLYNFLVQKGSISTTKRIIFFIDDAQRLHSQHYEWLMDIHNELDALGILLTVILVGQRELQYQRTAFVKAKKRQLIGRFMLHEYHFKGILNISDIKTCLESYDYTSIYPLDSSWTFTKFFFPQQYEDGLRLSLYADDLYSLFKDIGLENGLKSKVEIPMFYFTLTIENALRYFGVDGENVDDITKNQWKFCIQKTGYINAEKYRGMFPNEEGE